MDCEETSSMKSKNVPYMQLSDVVSILPCTKHFRREDLTEDTQSGIPLLRSNTEFPHD